MKRLEEKARAIVRNAYFEWLLAIKTNSPHSKEWCSTYMDKFDMLKELFPKSTNQETLEHIWDAMFRKEYR